MFWQMLSCHGDLSVVRQEILPCVFSASRDHHGIHLQDYPYTFVVQRTCDPFFVLDFSNLNCVRPLAHREKRILTLQKKNRRKPSAAKKMSVSSDAQNFLNKEDRKEEEC